MELKVYRISDNGESTLGALFIDDVFQCYTLEDEERTTKVFGETRIPEGTYKVALRKEGGHHARYSKTFSEFHKGMLHILDVPNFKWILIHIGNDEDDTAGCLLVGNSPNNNKIKKGFLGDSTTAYVNLYLKVYEAAEKEDLTITYINLEDKC
jgi:hypothetical protein